jgi:hypothetical protein
LFSRFIARAMHVSMGSEANVLDIAGLDNFVTFVGPICPNYPLVGSRQDTRITLSLAIYDSDP